MGAGRHREFDEQQALEAAMRCFWTNSYSGTSMAALTTAMGIGKPSLYAAYGNKDALFLRALGHYAACYAQPHLKELEQAGAPLRDRVRRFLTSVARMTCDPSLPGGCFIAETTGESGGDRLPAQISATVAAMNAQTKARIACAFAHDFEVGDLPKGTGPEALASYLLTIQFGLAAMGRCGVAADDLGEAIELAVAPL
ncbi:transcriptional regulator, TetR family [gamma proteobacterium NOR5-3]|nr:transcriptional regulator, TetR family [gamma proteobacterium NOR5-3]